MQDRDIIENTIEYVKNKLAQTESGHNWFHVERVWKMARKISENYKTDLMVIDLGSLLHDIADAKFYNGNENIGPEIATKFLHTLHVNNEIVSQVIDIIKYISFKNKGKKSPGFIEFKIIQDADRLDAIGAIGIARAFNYGGYKNKTMYNPAIKPLLQMSDHQYKTNNGPTINHFYEKLFKIKDLLYTKEAVHIAKERHRFMEDFVNRFKDEWECNDFSITL